MDTIENLDLALRNALLHLKAARSIAEHLDIDTQHHMAADDQIELEDALLTLSAIQDEGDQVAGTLLKRIDASNPGYLASVQGDLDEIEAAAIDRVRSYIHDGELRSHLTTRIAELWAGGARASKAGSGEMAAAADGAA